MRNLRRTLASIVLAAPIAGCLPGSCPKVDPIDETVPVPAMPDAMTMMDLVSCRATPTSCDALCEDIYKMRHPNEIRWISSCTLLTDSMTGAESVHYLANYQCIGGRRPAGYRRGRPCGHAVAAYLAQQAELEAASVHAFEDLLADLVAHDAPAALRRAARHAAADEVRHARLCDALARRHGMVPRYTSIPGAARRSRRELAIDNAVEGCMRETFGAAVAGYQARAAADPAIRVAMQSIWHDEARHAALSWRLHRWLAPRLDARERRAVADATAAARTELAGARAEAAEVCRVAGVPQPEVARAMLAALDAEVFVAL